MQKIQVRNLYNYINCKQFKLKFEKKSYFIDVSYVLEFHNLILQKLPTQFVLNITFE